MKTAIRAASALLLSAALVAILIIPVAADDFDLEVSVVRSIEGISNFVQHPTYSWYRSDPFTINQVATYIIPKNQSLPQGISLGSQRIYFLINWVSGNGYNLSQDDLAYYVTTTRSNVELRFWDWNFTSSSYQVIIKGSGFLSSDPFAFGWQYHFVPVTDSLIPLQGNYDIHLTSEYPYSALILYSVEPITDFGDLSSYYVSTSEVDLPVTSADRLYYDTVNSDIVLTPDYYSIGLPTTGYSYLFRNVPVGDYHINSAFTWQQFDPHSYTTQQLVFPYVYFYDDTQGQAQTALLDIWEDYENGILSASDAIARTDQITQILIESTDSYDEKLYWITYQKTIVERIQNTPDTSGVETMRAAFESSQDDMDNLIEQLHVDKPTVELPDLVDQGIDGSYIQQLFNPVYNSGFINSMMILAVSFGIIGYILYGRRA